MLLDGSQATVISHLGWVDRAGVWTFDLRTERETTVALGEAKYLSLHAGRDGHIAVVHHNDNARVEIAVHRFEDIASPLARAVIEAGESLLSGDPAAWAHVQAYYTAFYRGPHWTDYALIRVDSRNRRVELQRFEWFDDTYDKDYQGIVGVTEIPGAPLLLVTVQRSSTLVLHDPVRGKKVGIVQLAGNAGNPSLYFRRRADELWAVDYDTILRVEPGSWRIDASRRLQGASVFTGSQFVGNFWFDDGETMCLVARPFSGDIVALDPRTLKTVATCRTGGQPLEAVALADGRVIARDWQTGALLRGALG